MGDRDESNRQCFNESLLADTGYIVLHLTIRRHTSHVAFRKWQIGFKELYSTSLS